MTLPGSLADLLGTTVRVGTVRVGEVAGAFVDRHGRRVIGLEVSGPGGVRRFLPWFAASLLERDIQVSSALLIVDDGASYERIGARALRDPLTLAGMRVSADGAIEGAPETVSGAPLAGIRSR